MLYNSQPEKLGIEADQVAVLVLSTPPRLSIMSPTGYIRMRYD